MTIDLTPELEQALGEAARKQGTTVQSLALETLHERFMIMESAAEGPDPDGMSLADRLAYYIGFIDTGAESSGATRHSQSGASEFGTLLLKRHREGYR